MSRLSTRIMHGSFMKLMPEIIQKIAHLARLNLPDEDIPNHIQKLSNILDFVDQMNQVNTSNIEPLSHPLQVSQRLRPDNVTQLDQRDKYQQIAPLVEAGLYLVPKVIE